MKNYTIQGIKIDLDQVEEVHSTSEYEFMPIVQAIYPHARFLETHDGRQLIYVDNGANVLGIAHLDGTMPAAHFGAWVGYTKPNEDPRLVIFSPFVDDRSGAWTLLYALPQLGLNIDILLSVGEEIGQPTSEEFQPPEGKSYNWMFQFDRMGTDAVHYQYTDPEWLAALEPHFGQINGGSFSDIAFMDHLDICGVNIGTGYHQYTSMHEARTSMNELCSQIRKFEGFYNQYRDVRFEHDKRRPRRRRFGNYRQAFTPTTRISIDASDGGGEIQVTKRKQIPDSKEEGAVITNEPPESAQAAGE